MMYFRSMLTVLLQVNKTFWKMSTVLVQINNIFATNIVNEKNSFFQYYINKINKKCLISCFI